VNFARSSSGSENAQFVALMLTILSFEI